MAIPPTYPGVYIQQITTEPGGTTSTAIVAAPTSVTAFLGRTLLGPLDAAPTAISSFQDFNQLFGGLAVDLPLTYAVSQFFLNGGSQAIIVRLFEGDTSSATATLTFPNSLTLVAANPGTWGNHLTATVDTHNITPETAAQLQQYGITAADLFNLTLTYQTSSGNFVATERYLNLSALTTGPASAYPNRIDRILASSSSLARVSSLSGSTPAPATATAQGGKDSPPLSDATILGDPLLYTGLHRLDRAPVFNLLCIPPDVRLTATPAPQHDLSAAVRNAVATYCADNRAIFLVDPPAAWQQPAVLAKLDQAAIDALGITGVSPSGLTIARNAALYFPNIFAADPLANNEALPFAPCGAIAGIIAATDASRGVWKAPAGITAPLNGVTGLSLDLTDAQDGLLNPLGINCLRNFPNYGPVVWGDRTLRGAEAFADDYKYLSVRRLTLFIESSIHAGTAWAVFEPNDEALWSSLRLAITSFMDALYRQGAFFGYNVRCDSTTTTEADIAEGVVNILIQFAPIKPAEFIVIQIQQMAATPPA